MTSGEIALVSGTGKEQVGALWKRKYVPKPPPGTEIDGGLGEKVPGGTEGRKNERKKLPKTRQKTSNF